MWLLMLVLLQAPTTQDPPTERTGIAAKINGEIITWDQIELKLRDFPPEQRTDELRMYTRKKAAQDVLFLQFARQFKITVTDQDIDDAIKSERKAMGGDQERFENYLRYRNMTMTQYREDCRQKLVMWGVYRRLMAEARFRPDIHTVLLTENVSPEELRDYYVKNAKQFEGIQQITVYRIALKFATPEEKAEKTALAESLLRKIAGGTDFSSLAFYYTDVMTTDKNGKKMPGYRDLNRDQSEFSPDTTKYLFEELEVGKVSKIIEDGNSINLFKLEGREIRKEEKFEEAQQTIRAILENKKREENGELLLQELLKQSFVEPADLFKP